MRRIAEIVVEIVLIATTSYQIYLEDQKMFYQNPIVTASVILTFLWTIYVIIDFIQEGRR